MMTRNVLLTLTITTLGCDLGKSSLGEVPSDGDDEQTTTVSSGGDDEPGGLGAPCDPAPSDLIEAHLLQDSVSSCAERTCYFPLQVPPHKPCSESVGCGDPERYVCDIPSGECKFNPDFVASQSQCVESCEQDSDCVPVPGSVCETGYSCQVVAALGSQCCQKFCVCNDTFSVDQELQQACAAGTQPGCCDQTPEPDACGP